MGTSKQRQPLKANVVAPPPAPISPPKAVEGKVARVENPFKPSKVQKKRYLGAGAGSSEQSSSQRLGSGI